MRRLAPQVQLTLWFRALLSAVPVVLLSAVPVVAGPVLHVRFDPDPAEDLRLGATTPSGAMPATIETRSGMIVAPDESSAREQMEGHTYGGAHTPTSVDASYHLDRLTTRPDRVRYDEPFRPSILPFKRLYAFDQLEADLSFGLSSRDLTKVSVGGSVDHNEDAFFADFNVDMVRGVAVRIPSVGPGARIRAFHVDPPQEVEIVEDSAENWFVRGSDNGRVRMVMQLSIDRAVFGSLFRPVSWAALKPYLTAVPEEIVDTAREVAAHIGIDRSDSPARVMMTLVDYFRRFQESSALPVSTNSRELYRELAFDQKGVCRHRAYAFAVTALALGLPTRVVHNEAHAWVEVFDSEVWHRVDLGGAATNVQQVNPDVLAPNYRPPSDPYTWPEGSTAALDLAFPPAQTALARSDEPAAAPRGASVSSTPNGGVEQESRGRPGREDSWPSARRSTLDRGAGPKIFGREEEAPEVKLRLGESKLLRGRPLAVSGNAMRANSPCRLSRVDIYAHSPEGLLAIGSVATDRNGAFSGHVTLPPTVPVGHLTLEAKIAGGCD